jgi:hypothetical protein
MRTTVRACGTFAGRIRSSEALPVALVELAAHGFSAFARGQMAQMSQIVFVAGRPSYCERRPLPHSVTATGPLGGGQQLRRGAVARLLSVAGTRALFLCSSAAATKSISCSHTVGSLAPAFARHTRAIAGAHERSPRRAIVRVRTRFDVRTGL